MEKLIKQLDESLKRAEQAKHDATDYTEGFYAAGLKSAFIDAKCLLEQCDKGEISDGYHTFNELYHHRMILFAVICNSYKAQAWKSKLHHDGTMYDDYFIVGITTPKGDYTYHYHMDDWDYFDVKELPNAPEWDGHKPSDIDRLLTL